MLIQELKVLQVPKELKVLQVFKVEFKELKERLELKEILLEI